MGLESTGRVSLRFRPLLNISIAPTPPRFTRGAYRPLVPNKFTHNPDGSTSLFITRKSGEVFEAIIDAEEVERVRPHKWHIVFNDCNMPYVRAEKTSSGKRKVMRLHQFILGTDSLVDHQNGNTLDCRK